MSGKFRPLCLTLLRLSFGGEVVKDLSSLTLGVTHAKLNATQRDHGGTRECGVRVNEKPSPSNLIAKGSAFAALPPFLLQGLVIAFRPLSS